MTKSDPNDNPFQYMALHHMDDDDDFDLDQDMDENPEDIFADLDLHVEAFLDAFNPDLLEPLLNGHEGDADEHEIFPILVDPWIPDNGWEGVVVWDAVDADEHESVCIFPSPKIELDSVSSARKAREAREAYMKSLLNDPVLVRRATSLMRAACGLDSSGDSAPAPASGDAPSPGNCALEGLAMATAHEAAVDPFESEALGDDSLPAPDGDGFYKTPAQESTVGAPELEDETTSGAYLTALFETEEDSDSFGDYGADLIVLFKEEADAFEDFGAENEVIFDRSLHDLKAPDVVDSPLCSLAESPHFCHRLHGDM